jgi:Uma2 family endonuclease
MSAMSTTPDHAAMSSPGLAVFSTPRSPDAPPTIKRWNREEYYRLGEQGWFLNQRVELIDGEILEVSPQSFGHYWSIDAITGMFEQVFGNSYWVRSQAPCTHGEWSEPEPDVSVVKGDRGAFSDHPTTAVLAVEVSQSTLAFDRGVKSSLYASMGVPDYWVLDLAGRQLLVHRQPEAAPNARFGHNYAQVEAIPEDGFASPLEMPDAKLPIADMLPPNRS